ncbi:MAG: beta-lactamase family protein [Nocardiaceae bacterium]|nr:beta-lactamase family protein [Nocardiaceae bacterium]
MAVLDQLTTWPVDNVAGALVTMDGTETRGDSERVFMLASVTKLLVAYGALVAVEEGAIELDQLAGPPGSTVRHLLAHASGLSFRMDAIRRKPGERRIYSSTGYEVLADFIASETDIPFPDYLREAVFEPLGMTRTMLVGSAGHGARSTVADLTYFLGELLQPRLISPQLYQDAVSVQYPGLNGVIPGYGPQRPCDWGLGFELHDHKEPHWLGHESSPAAFGHFGQAGTFLWVDPPLRTGCVVLTDRPFNEWAKPLWAEFNDSVVRYLRSLGATEGT